MIREFKLAISEKTLNEIYARVQRYPWQALPDNSGWDLGTDTAYLKELCHYWVSDFDWYRHENEINRFDNFVAQIDQRLCLWAYKDNPGVFRSSGELRGFRQKAVAGVNGIGT